MSDPRTEAAVGDPGRLEALRRLGLLDSPPQAGFDRLTRLIQHVLRVPVALVTLVDDNRQFFLSAQGLEGALGDERETPLSSSFCQYVVGTGEMLRVENAVGDPLVGTNRAVTHLGVVAYLGMPLKNAEGFVLGALCAIDTQQRVWTAQDEAILADLAEMASNELALRELAGQLEARVQHEVAARTNAEGELARKRRLEVLGQLAGGVAHDFANVLQTVQAGVRLATSNLTRDPVKAERILERVAEAARRGGSITRRLLGFARRGELRVEPVSVAELLQGLQEVLAPTLHQPGLVLRIEPAEALPPIMADRGELETVLVNLATNARDAMPSGGTLVLSARLEEVGPDDRHPAGLAMGRYVALMSQDSGVGMTPETLARASEPFFTTKPEGEGTGLGLSMARDFAVQAEGGFRIDSQVGVGTCVTLWLPAVVG